MHSSRRVISVAMLVCVCALAALVHSSVAVGATELLRAVRPPAMKNEFNYQSDTGRIYSEPVQHTMKEHGRRTRACSSQVQLCSPCSARRCRNRLLILCDCGCGCVRPSVRCVWCVVQSLFGLPNYQADIVGRLSIPLKDNELGCAKYQPGFAPDEPSGKQGQIISCSRARPCELHLRRSLVCISMLNSARVCECMYACVCVCSSRDRAGEARRLLVRHQGAQRAAGRRQRHCCLHRWWRAVPATEDGGRRGHAQHQHSWNAHQHSKLVERASAYSRSIRPAQFRPALPSDVARLLVCGR